MNLITESVGAVRSLVELGVPAVDAARVVSESLRSDLPAVLTEADVMAVAKISRATLANEIGAGSLRCKDLGHKTKRFTRRSFLNWLGEREAR